MPAHWLGDWEGGADRGGMSRRLASDPVLPVPHRGPGLHRAEAPGGGGGAAGRPGAAPPRLPRPGDSPSWWESRLLEQGRKTLVFPFVRPHKRYWFPLQWIICWKVATTSCDGVTSPDGGHFAALICGLSFHILQATRIFFLLRTALDLRVAMGLPGPRTGSKVKKAKAHFLFWLV